MSAHDDRDLLLGRALRGLTPPDHAPGFWDELDGRLADEADRLPRVLPGGRSPDADDTDDTEQLVNLPSSPRNRRPRWLPALLASAAVAVVIAAVLGVVILREDDDEPTTITAEPTPSAEVTPAPEADGTPEPSPSPSGGATQPVDLLGPADSTVELGSGVAIGVSADGTHAYILDDDPAAGLGCEGEPGQSVWAQPLDGTVEDRFLAAPTGSFGYNVAMFPGPGGRVALVSNCEEFLTSIVIATEAADHTFTDQRTVLTGEDVVFVNSTTWTPDGRLLIAALGTDFEDRAVWAIDPDTGDRELVDDREALAAAVLADGTLVMTTTDSLIVGDVTEQYEGGGSGVALSPDGTALAVYGPEGLAVVNGTARQDAVAGQAVYDASWSPDGTVLAATTTGGDPTTFQLVTLDVAGAAQQDLGSAWYRAGTFAPDGRSLVTTTTATDTGSEFPEPMAVVLRWE